MIATLTDTPRAWIGCLACYNDGRLTGSWVDWPDAADYTPCHRPGHEEFWCFDHEHLPIVHGEISPHGFARLAEAWTNVTDHYDPTVAAAYIDHVGRDYVDWDTIANDLEEAYIGEYDTIAAYAEAFYDDTTNEDERPSGWPYTYIDWEAAGRDLVLSGDIWTADGPHGVHLFRALR